CQGSGGIPAQSIMRAGSLRTCSKATAGFRRVKIFLARAASEAVQRLLDFRKERSKSGMWCIWVLAVGRCGGDLSGRVQTKELCFVVQNLEGGAVVFGFEATSIQAAPLQEMAG